MVNLTAFIETKLDEDPKELAPSLRQLRTLWAEEPWALQLIAMACLVADLVDQGWSVTPEGARICLSPPGIQTADETTEAAKDRLRRALQVGRERQLASPSVRQFVDRFSRPAQNNGHRSSALDVVDSGAELATELADIGRMPDAAAWDRLRKLVDPVLVACDDVTRCSTTGIRLMDLWRYFRHTWSLEYRSMPGRQVPVLIRNQARPGSPVMGIGLLASPVLRTRSRDEWIGWTPEAFVRAVQNGAWPAKKALRALAGRINDQIGNIRHDDLASSEEVAHPTERVIFRLEQKAEGAALSRERQLQEDYAEAFEERGGGRSQADPAKRGTAHIDWLEASNDLLFVQKRAATLARLLEAKREFQAIDWTRTGDVLLNALTASVSGARALSTALQEVRNSGLASQVADLSVCGAVTPYNVLLGGKLVALAMSSREVQAIWRERYSDQISIISSQMAGRPIRRSAELCMLTTTSLYGSGSSQYNRLRLRMKDHPGLSRDVIWRELDQTAGYGTVHLSMETVRLLRTLSEVEHGARRINNRFGEGTSPRLRQVREGLEVLGIESDDILHHATPRLFYACELAPDAKERLMGMRTASATPAPTLASIAEGWRRRWLLPRVRRQHVQEQLALVGPANVKASLAGSLNVISESLDQDQLSLEV